MTGSSSSPTTFHVACSGSDSNPGSLESPFRTIQYAAEQAQPGDTVLVHAGIYREQIQPPRSGMEDAPICFQAAGDGEVILKGSEQIQDWEHVEGDLWQACLPNRFFGNYNPYAVEVAGDWFRPLPAPDRVFHTGAVYLKGHWLTEAASKQDLLNGELGWFGEVDEENTTLYARFGNENPNEVLVEINVRETVFYPKLPGIHYIQVKGFCMEQAACNWAPPTAEQVALIGTHWSRGWVIEDNCIRYAMCCGISLGKYGDEWDNRAESAEGYVGTIKRAHAQGWAKGRIGHHLVRNNEISHCEQAGIVGSMGCSFSQITENHVHHINQRGLFSGEEMAGIKFHGAIDTCIDQNHVHDCCGFGGLWLDWMSQGTRVTRNLFHDNVGQDLFVEVNHGPFLVDHNLFLSGKCLLESSGGGAYAHNLFAGDIVLREEPDRETPCHPPHSTEILKLAKVIGDDERFINNVFSGGKGLSGYAAWNPEHLAADGNLYLGTAQPSPVDRHARHLSSAEVDIAWQEDRLTLTMPENPEQGRSLVSTERLGLAIHAQAPYVDAEGRPYRLDTDYFWQPHDIDAPRSGPFASGSTHRISLGKD